MQFRVPFSVLVSCSCLFTLFFCGYCFAGSIEKVYDSKGNLVRTIVHEEYGRENDPNWVKQPHERYNGMSFEDTFADGMRRWEKKDYSGAHIAFKTALSNHGYDTETFVFMVKTSYLDDLHRDPSNAKSFALSTLDRWIKEKPQDKEVLSELKWRIDHKRHPETFSAEAYELMVKGKEEFKKGNFKESSKLLYGSLKLDPYNRSAWNGYKFAQLEIGGKKGYDNTIKEAKKFFPDYK